LDDARVQNMTRPRDTSPEAFAIQMERLRKAGPEARLAMAADMSDAVRELVTAGFRDRHPDLDDREVAEAVARVLTRTRATGGVDG
jgi:hypothetical protein